MAAGVTVKHKRKTTSFTNGQLQAGEFGLDTNDSVWYYSADGTTVELLSQAPQVGSLPTAGIVGRIVFLTTDNHFYGDNGTSWDDLTNGKTLRAYQTVSIEYINDNTLGDTELSATVETGGIYAIEMILLSYSDARALKYDLNGGTATVTKLFAKFIFEDISAIAAEAQATESLNAVVSPTGLDGAGVLADVKGTMEVDAGGTFILRAAQRLSHSDYSSFDRGSYLHLTKLN